MAARLREAAPPKDSRKEQKKEQGRNPGLTAPESPQTGTENFLKNREMPG